MIDSFVTQCPHCSTSFRVTRAQLGAARGAVRCGACMQVFNAGQQLLIDQPGVLGDQPPPSPSPAKSPVTPAPASKAADDTLWIHDDLDLDGLDLDEELARLEQQEMQLSREFVALERGAKPAEQILQRREESPHSADEAWAEALLREEIRDLAAPSPSTVASEPIESLAISATTDVQPLDVDDEPTPQVERQAEDGEDDFALSAVPDEPPVADQPRSQESFSALPPLGRKERQADDSLSNLNDEPLQFDWEAPRKPWGRWIAWGLLNLIAAVALASQYIAYHFDELARQDQYRPWFEQLCPTLGCQLPSKVDIDLIKSSNLVVRSHPEFAGALVVDAILYNRAPFSQPFPLLEMRFADIGGQLLASRRFKPSEYLAGELAGQAEMPPQTPIHISLDILDPGTKAVNYSLSFLSPE
ncbi:DUF3426 domain-containing protein [Pseudomonas sp. LS44]|uniref:DUF3426 domain-containing protein n=1 Tax=Pseudomonas sp. LS44 TaxID=1357074 RepID=UPI00215A5786|nr:DUF3426 domain-containing protein [Pseudomonas sp. LS44]UVE17235.1 DUF3426 domain-containing protein [Pseudomonas sp. LS44]